MNSFLINTFGLHWHLCNSRRPLSSDTFYPTDIITQRWSISFSGRSQRATDKLQSITQPQLLAESHYSKKERVRKTQMY